MSPEASLDDQVSIVLSSARLRVFFIACEPPDLQRRRARPGVVPPFPSPNRFPLQFIYCKVCGSRTQIYRCRLTFSFFGSRVLSKSAAESFPLRWSLYLVRSGTQFPYWWILSGSHSFSSCILIFFFYVTCRAGRPTSFWKLSSFSSRFSLCALDEGSACAGRIHFLTASAGGISVFTTSYSFLASCRWLFQEFQLQAAATLT